MWSSFQCGGTKEDYFGIFDEVEPKYETPDDMEYITLVFLRKKAVTSHEFLAECHLFASDYIDVILENKVCVC